ncbi:hypothetical protein SAMD00019534_059770 [Acytostelium subglobosum LB1]|uniref:hypothetical protein n=1 Tax=Acytostelium subglobosum LB1 TaxID=1410327 RepID=UPI0006449DE8|nr:hypothetical protein SAMD00019534_059770 [Acytostelium subglobosum LB1]GAM22802.1 hypothetical protein SAMD00019534_059770 [Acytostelium subglobosum LB1]|eukprot:XP_012754029.1 hypothetical protein SAMD00019534_059770 [Acytostelium subglobosum LB1]
MSTFPIDTVDNSEHPFVNLSHVLLQTITNNLYNIDRICFTFVCQRWYRQKDDYLLLETLGVPVSAEINEFKHKRVLKSYLKIIEFSLLIKRETHLLIAGEQSEIDMLTWLSLDYMLLPDKPIPSSVTRLELGDTFNQPLSVLETLPTSSIRIMSSKSFNQPLEAKMFPPTLTELYLGKSFNQKLTPGCLPSTLKSITFGWDFCQDINPGVLPDGLLKLRYSHHWYITVVPNSIPSSVVDIEYFPVGSLHLLPTSVTRLHLFLLHDMTIPVGAIKSHVVDLEVGNFAFQFAEGMLPPSLTKLHMGTVYNHPVTKGVFPDTLTELQVSSALKYPMGPGVLPLGLKKIQFGYCWNIPLEPADIPDSVTYLRFEGQFDQPIHHHVLPKNLETLHFGDSYNQILKPGVLPQTLKTLIFGSSYQRVVHPDTYPVGMSTLTVRSFKFFEVNRPNDLPKTITSIEAYGLYRTALRRLNDSLFLGVGGKFKSSFIRSDHHFMDDVESIIKMEGISFSF